MARRIIDKFEKGKNYVLTGFRNPGEIRVLEDLDNIFVVMIDAPLKLRFERALKGGEKESNIRTFKEFKKMEERDFGINQPEYGQQNAALFKMADKVIVNDGSFEELKEKVGELLKELDK